MASCVKVTTAKTLENALAKFKTPETYPAYEIRHDYHQSQSSVSISFYAKCVKPDSFRIQLMSGKSIIYRAGIDENADFRVFVIYDFRYSAIFLHFFFRFLVFFAIFHDFLRVLRQFIEKARKPSCEWVFSQVSNEITNCIYWFSSFYRKHGCCIVCIACMQCIVSRMQNALFQILNMHFACIVLIF